MQSTVLSLSPSLSLRKPHTRVSASTSKPNVIVTSSFSSSSFPCQPCSLASSCSSPLSFKLAPSPPSHARATSVPESSAGESSGVNTLELGALFGFWFLFNIYFNIYNKQVLKVYHFHLTVSALQFAAGTPFSRKVSGHFLRWGSNLYNRPKVSGAQLAEILPLALVHTLGNVFTNMSLGKVAVSFTHKTKAREPFFSVLLSAMFLGEVSYMILQKVSPVTHSGKLCQKGCGHRELCHLLPNTSITN